MRKLEYVVIAL